MALWALPLNKEGVWATEPEAATRGHTGALSANGPEAAREAPFLPARVPQIGLARLAQVEACLSGADRLEVRR